MSFVDMAYMKKADIHSGMLQYERTEPQEKTEDGSTFSVCDTLGHHARHGPMSIIRDCLKTTQIYLSTIDTTAVAKANRKIMDAILK